MRKKIAYFDCFAGVSGDMCIAALVDSGIGLHILQSYLAKLSLPGVELKQSKVIRSGIQGTFIEVITPENDEQHHHHNHHHHPHRKLADIYEIINKADLPETLKEKARKVFVCLAKAEAKVHGKDIETIAFHEVGALDAVVDVITTITALHIAGIEEVYCSPIEVGGGTVETAHGTLPVPCPASVEILRGVPMVMKGLKTETATPTGCALMVSMAKEFGPCPPLNIHSVGYGAGSKEIKGISNFLRVLIGEKIEPEQDNRERVIEINCNIDDMNPEIYSWLMEKLYLEGAIEVWWQNIGMKKSRPGILLSVLTSRQDADKIAKIILQETTTLGVRMHKVDRIILKREIKEIKTKWGKMKVKIAYADRSVQPLRITPEYEDCKKIAQEFNLPLLEVYRELEKLSENLQ